MTLPPYQLVTTEAAWRACLAQLQGQPRLAIDLEANSMYAYREQVCLIQISIPGKDFIIDPLPDYELDGLGVLIEDPAVEKVFHAAEYDLILLKREFGWELRNLFDTMWAARILGYSHMGLAHILESLYQVQLNKKFQKADWCRRPLNQQQLFYAQCDTHYLLDLRDHFEAELGKAGRWVEAQEIFAEQSQIRLNSNQFDPDGFWTMNGVRHLNRENLAVLKALYVFRDEEAKRLNRPYFKILGDQTMLEIAQLAPRRLDQLQRIEGMSSGQVERYGRHMLQLIEANRDAPPPARPKRPRRQPDTVVRRYERLQEWRKQQAAVRGVESDVIINRDAMWAIAQAYPQTVEALAELNVLGPWRLNEYGRRIVVMLNRASPE